ncbi:MAG: coproporphyrinogen III oxidase family protein [Planctomycetes bacterium]|nr:coproporphyrinogen III oxidase family protein [Planctomycetota bacterium]
MRAASGSSTDCGARRGGETSAGLYVHVPFCRSRCGYCAFVSSPLGKAPGALMRDYVECLALELRRRMFREGAGLRFDTLYVGGGTPSTLPADLIDRLFELIGEETRGGFSEITFECNPEDLRERPQLPAQLEALGVSRLSVGVQSFEARGLRALERGVDEAGLRRVLCELPEQFGGAIIWDLILGWPGQESEGFMKNEVEMIARLLPAGLSVYSLIYEAGTRLHKGVLQGRVTALDQDGEAELWQVWLEAAERMGYRQVEISSFTRAGEGSRHNRDTWLGKPYLGIGCGAVSRLGRVRWSNCAGPQEYIDRLRAGRWPAASAEFLNPERAWQEELMLRLRHERGLDFGDFAHRHGFHPEALAGDLVADALGRGWLLRMPGGLRFSPAGWMLYDGIVSDWMMEIEKALGR